jgi:hypothetical protein
MLFLMMVPFFTETWPQRNDEPMEIDWSFEQGLSKPLG